MTRSLRRTPARRGLHRFLAALATVVAVAACSGDGSDGASGDATMAAADADDTLTMGLAGAAAVALGEPLEVTMTISNDGERGLPAPVEMTLVAPDGSRVAFYTTVLFVGFGETVTELVTVTTSRWYPQTGDFEIVAEVTDPTVSAAAASISFTVEPSERLVPRFEDVTEQAGLVTTVPVPECGQFSNGAAWGDVDGDGLQDLVVTRLGDRVQLFRNAGDGTFAEQSDALGVTASGANGAAFADYDNDGDADLMLVGDGADVLYRNGGDGTFEDVTAIAGVAGDPANRGMSASWGDFDSDGLLDLYVTNYMECSGDWTTAEDIIANVAYHPDVLYRNEGDGTFSDVTAALPESSRPGAGFSAAWLDADGDNRLDLYLANDFVGISPDHNRLWRNDGDGGAGWSFSDISLESGAGLYMNTMGIGVGDVDRDGDLDMALSNIAGNRFLRGNGDGTFVVEPTTGIERPKQGTDHSTVTWATAFYDLDLDGWEDLFMAAGNLQQAPEVVIGEQPNMVFLNDGSGTRFLDVSALTGIDDVDESKGAAFADYDRDGAIDVFVVNQAGEPRLYRNVTPRHDNHWLEVELVGSTSNRDGCGARVLVSVGDQSLMRQVLCGSGGSGSYHQRAVHFGLGTATAIDRVEVLWPSGTRQTLDDVDVDASIVVEESAT